MRVFVAIFDVESSTGGGQTIYRQIFRHYPDIQFTYLLDDEPQNYPRPANVHGIKLGPRYVRNAAETSLLMDCFCWAKTIAGTIREQDFDVVEIPDFMSDFCFLPAALLDAGKSPVVAVALHGLSSKTLELEWPPVGRVDSDRIQAEQLLFKASDVRYGISQAYLDEWLPVSSLPTQFVDPLAWLKMPTLKDPVPNRDRPSLYFIGRTERRKGPDLFIEAISKLNRNSYKNSSIIGPSVPISKNWDSNQHLQSMIQSRGLDTQVLGRKSPEEMSRIYAGRSITILPSRYDTLNLIALESLLSGCPTVIGNNAGVCRYLKDHLPAVPFGQFDLNDINAAANEIARIVDRYDEIRDELINAVKSLPVNRPLPDLQAIYANCQHDLDGRDASIRLYQQFVRSEKATNPSLGRRLKQLVARSPRLSKTVLRLQEMLSNWNSK